MCTTLFPPGVWPQRSAHLIRLWLLLVTVLVITMAVLVPHPGPCCERLPADTVYSARQVELGASPLAHQPAVQSAGLWSPPQNGDLLDRVSPLRLGMPPGAQPTLSSPSECPALALRGQRVRVWGRLLTDSLSGRPWNPRNPQPRGLVLAGLASSRWMQPTWSCSSSFKPLNSG